jgi:transposase
MNNSKKVVGVDIAKRVFQLHWINMETGEIVSLQLKREKLLEHFANQAPCLIGMEACGGSQHWARKLAGMGHQVKLMPAKAVRPFVGGNKSDVHDARAIWTAVQQPNVKAVAVKTEAQQAVLALHRMRQQLVKFRTAQINGLRGLLTEYGEVMPQGKAGLKKGIAEALQRLADRLPAMVIETLREQWARIGTLDEQIVEIERRLKIWHKEDQACQRIADIPGVGLLTATAAVATMGEAKAFKSGREFAAWLGLVPRQTGTGGRIRLLGISKRGDTYLRTLLIHGARSVLTHAKEPAPWITALRQRRPLNIAVVALANKMARTIWALLAHERAYQTGFVSQSA